MGPAASERSKRAANEGAETRKSASISWRMAGWLDPVAQGTATFGLRPKNVQEKRDFLGRSWCAARMAVSLFLLLFLGKTRNSGL